MLSVSRFAAWALFVVVVADGIADLFAPEIETMPADVRWCRSVESPDSREPVDINHF